jgi:hypothetical protein
LARFDLQIQAINDNGLTILFGQAAGLDRKLRIH